MKLEKTLATAADIGSNFLGTPAQLATGFWRTTIGQSEEQERLAAMAHTSPEEAGRRSHVIRHVAELRADDFINDWCCIGAGAAGTAATVTAATAIFGPLGTIAGLGAGLVGNMVGANAIASFLGNRKEALVSFLETTQQKIDNRQVRGEDVFVHALLSVPKKDMKHIMAQLDFASNGKIKNLSDLLTAVSEDPPNEKKLQAIRLVQHDKDVNMTLSVALGLKAGAFDNPENTKTGVLATDKLAALLNNRPAYMQHISILNPGETFALTHKYNLYQVAQEQRHLQNISKVRAGDDKQVGHGGVPNTIASNKFTLAP